MKTLDEVIKEFERQEAFVAYYMQDGTQFRSDALHYLKELRDMTDIPMEYFEYGGTSQKLRNTSQITCPKCHSEFVILPESNDPLTWEQLKQMEGKPVWVEQHHGDTKGWLLILRKCDDVVTCTTKHGNSFYLYKANYGEKWQAYRKERE